MNNKKIRKLLVGCVVFLTATMLSVSAFAAQTGNTECDEKGHYWITTERLEDPTCIWEGLDQVTCLRCGETSEIVVDPLGHKWGTSVVLSAAQPGIDGQAQHTCLRCGTVETVRIPALPQEDMYLTLPGAEEMCVTEYRDIIYRKKDTAYFNGTAGVNNVTITVRQSDEMTALLTSLKKGDVVQLRTQDGAIYQYQVVEEYSLCFPLNVDFQKKEHALQIFVTDAISNVLATVRFDAVPVSVAE
ncbi:MAG: hypothetical protein ACI4JC_03335 [Faecalibacterium sp.]